MQVALWSCAIRNMLTSSGSALLVLNLLHLALSLAAVRTYSSYTQTHDRTSLTVSRRCLGPQTVPATSRC